MVNNKSIQPIANELPSHFADRLGIYYASTVNQEHKKENGQFFTPVPIARFIIKSLPFEEITQQKIEQGKSVNILLKAFGLSDTTLCLSISKNRLNINPSKFNKKSFLVA